MKAIHSLFTPGFRPHGPSSHGADFHGRFAAAGRVLTCALAFFLTGLPPAAFAQMRERYVTQDAGSQRAFVVALDEFHSEDGDRKPRKQSVSAVATAEAMRAAVERYARRTGEAAEVVLYEEGVPRTEFSRRVLTKQIAVRLRAGVDPAALALKLGLISRGVLSGVPGWFIFETRKTGGVFDAAEALRKEPGVEAAEPQLARLRAKRSVPTDPLFNSQWHLRDTNSSPGVYGIDVRSVWDTWRGSGIRIGIVDDGIQTSHPDLSANLDTTNDHDWLDVTPDDVNPRLSVDWHGTPCAGTAAARQNNSLGVSGVAPEATLVGLRLIADFISVTDAQEAEAMAWRNDIIQVKSNSWGEFDNGVTVGGPGTLTQAALANAAQNGRGGLGTIFVWAAGNARELGDNSNYDGYANSIYAIAVAASGINSQQVFYSERGANLTVTAPSDDGFAGIVTTDLTGSDGYNDGSEIPGHLDYTNTFGGTSASCPMVAGCVALLLQSKPTLGWRDVQEILLRSAAKLHPTDSDWVDNAAGLHFNHKYGAGLVNTQAAVNLAANWVNRPPQQNVESAQTGLSVVIPDNNPTGITRTFDLSASNLRVEHVTVTVNINHASRGQLGVTLTSPSGMQSVLAETHGDTGDNYTNWTFSTVRCWGENSAGTWTLKITDIGTGTTGTLTSATLKVYGSPKTVTTAADSGPGSLRQAIADAAASPGPDSITFDSSLSGQTIQLTTNTSTGPTNDRSSLIISGATGGITIDATTLPGGITLSDNLNTTYRLLKITNSTVTLRGLTFKDGGITTFGNSSGGAIATSGSTVTIERCTFTGNVGDGGGAIFADHTTAGGSMTLTNCTLAGNYTISAGPNTGDGGAIFNYGGTMTLTHCTVAGNNAPTGNLGTGGIMGYLGTVTLTNCIVAGNTANGAPADVRYHSSTLVINGINIIPASTNAGALTNNGTTLTDDPKLAPLGNYGGPTKTMALLPGSPARDATTSSPITSDQRGFAKFRAEWDIGAHEAQIGAIANVTINEDNSTGAIGFIVGNAGTFSATSSNTALVPNGNIAFGGSGSNRTVTVTPAANQNGTAIITVNDSLTNETQTFQLTVNPANDAPTISNIVDLAINEDGATGAIAFTIGDIETAAGSLSVSGTSSNTALVPNANIVVGGSGANRTVTVTPVANQNGSCTITINVSDGALTTNDTFILTVNPVNDAPTISNIADLAINEDGATGAIAFTIGDIETAAGSLSVSGTSSNTALVPNANIVFGGSGASRTVTVTPVANQNGSCTISINVSDGTSTTNDTFILTVNPVNDAPSFTKGANQVASISGGARNIVGWATALSAGPADEAGQTLTFLVTNYNNALFSVQPAVSSTGTLSFTPSATTGSATVSVSVQDSGGTANGGVNTSAVQTFTITTYGNSTVVSTSADSGTGSLRQAIINKTFDPGAAPLTFDPGFTGPILLNSAIVIDCDLTINASTVAGGVTVSGHNVTGLFVVNSSRTVNFTGLTLTNGRTSNSEVTGGAILNRGTLNLTQCTLSNNIEVGRGGGAISNVGTGVVTLSRCTLFNNSGNAWGAISNDEMGSMTVVQCTFSGNLGESGGAVANFATLTMKHCTLSGNVAGWGGAIYNNGTGTLHLINNLIGGNTGDEGNNIYNSGTITTSGTNFVGDTAFSGLTANGTSLLSGIVLLAPLGNYGGPTQTMALMLNSPARNAATVLSPAITTDQRGFAIVGTPDLGAYEAGTFTDFTAWIYETLPATSTTPQRAATFDFDGDGQTNEQEWAALTDPGNAASYFRVNQSAISGNTFSVTFPTASGRTYQLQSSPNLANPWTNIGNATAGTGSDVTLPVNVTGFTKFFFRVSVQ
jgi:subtilisin-like proprotein convertase family protein